MPDKPWGIPDAAAVPVPDAGDDTLREQLAETLRSTPADYPGDERAREWSLHMIDALLPRIREHVVAAVQAERERLTHERDTWRDRANRAAAQVAQVRTLHGPCNDGCPNCHECALAEPCPTIRALDGTEATS